MNYMILLFILLLFFIQQVNAGLGNFICYGLCMAIPSSITKMNYILLLNNPNLVNFINLSPINYADMCNNLCFNTQQTITQ